MTPIRLQLLTPVVLACLLALGGLARADYDYIDITNPFLRKIPMAVPVFKPVAGHPAERQAAAQAADQLAGALEFTGYFKILDRGAFLVKPETMGIIAPNIKFQDWTAIGAELLVTGGLSLKDQYLEMELRLFDTFKSQLLIGKRYKGLVADQRRMIHRFCGEVIFALTGSHGIFDSRIAFVSSGPGNKEIFTADFDGHAPQQLTRNQGHHPLAGLVIGRPVDGLHLLPPGQTGSVYPQFGPAPGQRRRSPGAQCDPGLAAR
jgi:TolB protein